MKISDASNLRHDGTIPGTSLDYHIVVVMEDEVLTGSEDGYRRPAECLIRWWGQEWDSDVEAMERRFDLDWSERDAGHDASPQVGWHHGDHDPSGAVATFVRESWAPEQVRR
jgi:hypothetical protein